MLVPAKPFHPSLINVSKAEAYQGGASFKCSTWFGALNIRLGWRKASRDEHSSLLGPFASNEDEKLSHWHQIPGVHKEAEVQGHQERATPGPGYDGIQGNQGTLTETEDSVPLTSVTKLVCFVTEV